MVEHLPDIQTLFGYLDGRYFGGRLGRDGVILEWSNRMTRCAGICYNRNGAITIRLSRPLLQYRPFADTIDTLAHEMIHAYLFLTGAYSRTATAAIDRDGHGPEFQTWMNRINSAEGTHVTIYHSFHREVGSLQRHVWQCQGSCREWPPYFGIVRRAMNRPPQPADSWWAEHQARCGGTFVKTSGDQEKKTSQKGPISKKQETKGPLDIYFEALSNGRKLKN